MTEELKTELIKYFEDFDMDWNKVFKDVSQKYTPTLKFSYHCLDIDYQMPIPPGSWIMDKDMSDEEEEKINKMKNLEYTEKVRQHNQLCLKIYEEIKKNNPSKKINLKLNNNLGS